MKLTKQQVFREAKDYFFIMIGLVLYSLGWTGFLLPNEITTGGVTGISALIFFSTKIPIGVSYFVINAILLMFSIKLFGFKFSLKTIINVLIISVLLSYLQSVIKEPLVKGETFMNAILGGVLCGTGLGLVFNYKGSTGGTDIIALIINKYKSGISIGRGLLLCDVLIISCSWFIFQSIEKIVYGLVVMAVVSYTIDLVLNGARQSVQFFIFSEKYAEIADAINKQANRGCTLLDGTGWYSKKPVKVIIVMVKKTESTQIFRLVKGIDPNAFISQSEVRGVYGAGFEQIKA
ncbi:YitT family protein [Bacteroidales bacterium OttesenSCG-928-J19]|nr:YitT family protein [Bacteroidales bacterium OttesenSCG-928-J19]